MMVPLRPSHLRISAIVGSDTGNYAGIVDQETRASRLLRVGNQFGGYRVVEIDPEAQSVELERDGEGFILFLQGDETYMASLSDLPEWEEREEWDDDLLAEPAVTREQFLRENAERLGIIEPGAPLPREWVEPVTQEEALRRMAESVGMPVPDDAFTPRTREDFLRDFAPPEEQNP